MEGFAVSAKTKGPRILLVDLETSPNLADVWGIWQQNVALSQLRATTAVICFAAKWYDEKQVHFYSDYHDGHAKMIKHAHRMLDEADIVITYNGINFDIKHFQREFVLAGLNPPSPFKNIDLLRVVKSQFRFVSNKLQHVSDQLGIGQKTPHTGHELWVKCLEGDEKSWALMKKYNIQDVHLTQRLYDRLGSWIKDHPSYALYTGIEHSWPRCGGTRIQKRGLAYTTTGSYQRYQCRDCGGWSKGKSQEAGIDLRGIK